MQGIRSINGRHKTDGEVKNSVGNAKELTGSAHGHELRGGSWWEGVEGLRGIKKRKWDICNSIINKIYFLKIK